MAAGAEAKKMVPEFEKQYTEVCNVCHLAPPTSISDGSRSRFSFSVLDVDNIGNCC